MAPARQRGLARARSVDRVRRRRDGRRTSGRADRRRGRSVPPFAGLLDAHDLRIGNLECVVASGGNALANKPFTFRADPGVLPVLKRHFDGMSLANNHSGDFGKAAFAEQLELMRHAGLAGFGGGRNATEAHAPLILTQRAAHRPARLRRVQAALVRGRRHPAGRGLERRGRTGDRGHRRRAPRPPCRHRDPVHALGLGGGSPAQPAAARVRAADDRRRRRHGGRWASARDPGADVYKGKPIIYSLGNFLFNSFETEATTTGWVLSAKIGPEGVRSWRTHVARLDADGVPRPAPGAASPCGKAGDATVALCKGAR